MEKDDLGISVLKSACSSEAKELAVEWAELGLDSMLADGVLKDAPFLGSVVKICMVSKTIRDKLFVRKVWDFIRACPKFTDSEKASFAREHLEDPQKAQKLGDVIVLILDKLDDLEKPTMLAKLFAALVRGKIPLECFRRLAAAIDIGFIEDLKAMVCPQMRASDSLFIFLPNLVRTGLAVIGEKPDDRAYIEGSYRVDFQVSQLGEILVKSMNE
jgi:hypothetical protein